MAAISLFGDTNMAAVIITIIIIIIIIIIIDFNSNIPTGLFRNYLQMNVNKLISSKRVVKHHPRV